MKLLFWWGADVTVGLHLNRNPVWMNLCSASSRSIAWGAASFEKCNKDYNEHSPMWRRFDLTIYYTQGRSWICVTVRAVPLHLEHFELVGLWLATMFFPPTYVINNKLIQFAGVMLAPCSLNADSISLKCSAEIHSVYRVMLSPQGQAQAQLAEGKNQPSIHSFIHLTIVMFSHSFQTTWLGVCKATTMNNKSVIIVMEDPPKVTVQR